MKIFFLPFLAVVTAGNKEVLKGSYYGRILGPFRGIAAPLGVFNGFWLFPIITPGPETFFLLNVADAPWLWIQSWV